MRGRRSVSMAVRTATRISVTSAATHTILIVPPTGMAFTEALTRRIASTTHTANTEALIHRTARTILTRPARHGGTGHRAAKPRKPRRRRRGDVQGGGPRPAHPPMARRLLGG